MTDDHDHSYEDAFEEALRQKLPGVMIDWDDQFATLHVGRGGFRAQGGAFPDSWTTTVARTAIEADQAAAVRAAVAALAPS